jgi:hypothetical protein
MTGVIQAARPLPPNLFTAYLVILKHFWNLELCLDGDSYTFGLGSALPYSNLQTVCHWKAPIRQAPHWGALNSALYISNDLKTV